MGVSAHSTRRWFRRWTPTRHIDRCAPDVPPSPLLAALAGGGRRGRITSFPIQVSNSPDTRLRPAAPCAGAMPEISRPLKLEGAGNAGCPMHPQPGVRILVVSMHASIHSGGTGNIRHSPRDGFNSLSRALPGDRLCPRHSLDYRASLPGWARATPSKLDTSIGVSGPHALAVRKNAARLRAPPPLTNCFALRLHLTRTTPSRPPHPTTNVRDDREPPLLWGGMAGANHIFRKNGIDLFLQGGLDR